jgi:hypothetical protein
MAVDHLGALKSLAFGRAGSIPAGATMLSERLKLRLDRRHIFALPGR